MTKSEWQAHYRETGPHDTRTCPECQRRAATKRANARARERSSAMRDLGMRRTRYGWE